MTALVAVRRRAQRWGRGGGLGCVGRKDEGVEGGEEEGVAVRRRARRRPGRG